MSHSQFTIDYSLQYYKLVMATHNETGKNGELLAHDWLLLNGFSILHHNWRYSRYEIDIIATRGKILHFTEVKTRRNHRFGFPEEAVSKKKMRSLMLAAEEYLSQNPQWKRVQYNILSISLLENEEPRFFLIEDVYGDF
jgi:putative endonuclease